MSRFTQSSLCPKSFRISLETVVNFIETKWFKCARALQCFYPGTRNISASTHVTVEHTGGNGSSDPELAPSMRNWRIVGRRRNGSHLARGPVVRTLRLAFDVRADGRSPAVGRCSRCRSVCADRRVVAIPPVAIVPAAITNHGASLTGPADHTAHPLVGQRLIIL